MVLAILMVAGNFFLLYSFAVIFFLLSSHFGVICFGVEAHNVHLSLFGSDDNCPDDNDAIFDIENDNHRSVF